MNVLQGFTRHSPRSFRVAQTSAG